MVGTRNAERDCSAIWETSASCFPRKRRRKTRKRKAATKAKWAINVDALVLAGKAFAVFTMGSLSLMVSLIDSALDLLCMLVIWSANQLVHWRLSALRKRLPVCRCRLEPLGILVFSVIMIISFMQILKDSLVRITLRRAETEVLSSAVTGSLLVTITAQTDLPGVPLRVRRRGRQEHHGVPL